MKELEDMKTDESTKSKRALTEVIQVGVVTRDVVKMAKTLTDIFGIGPFKILEPDYKDKTYRGKPGNFKIRIALATIGPLQLELIQPLEGESIYNDFLKTKGDGLHHIAFRVPDLKEKIEEFKKIGIDVTQSGWRDIVSWAYLDTEPFIGVIFELHERRDFPFFSRAS